MLIQLDTGAVDHESIDSVVLVEPQRQSSFNSFAAKEHIQITTKAGQTLTSSMGYEEFMSKVAECNKEGKDFKVLVLFDKLIKEVESLKFAVRERR